MRRHNLPDITQDHVNLITRIARNLAHTHYLGRREGPDELESHSLLVLWDLARSWCPKKAPFTQYVAMFGRKRLIDWLRVRHGRYGTQRHAETPYVNPLDEVHEAELPPAPTPDPADVVTARETLAEAAALIDKECSPRQRDALLATATDDLEVVAEKWDTTPQMLMVHRSHARTRLRQAMRRRRR